MSRRDRKTHGKTQRGRSHIKNDPTRLSDDGDTYHQRHRVNMETGKYRGEQVIDVEDKKQKKLDRVKDKARAQGADPSEVDSDKILEPDQSLQS